MDADDEAWDFGSAWNYPALKYGGLDVAAQRNDYDADGDGLIEITRLGQLDAVRWDLDGDGAPAPGATSTAAYFSATSSFFNAVFNAAGTGLACPTTPDDADDNDCAGYELRSDLDFDTDGSGGTWTESGGTATGDANDAYDNGGMGWDPIGPAAAVTDATHFNAKFDGNGKIIDNLFVNRSRNRSGLFAGLAADAEVVALGLPDARVQAGLGRVGALVGDSRGHVGAVWASGSVTGGANTGGLVGDLSGGGSVVASYSTAVVTCAGAGSTGAGLVGNRAGGNSSSIAASYSTGRVTGPCASTAGFALGGGGRGDGELLGRDPERHRGRRGRPAPAAGGQVDGGTCRRRRPTTRSSAIPARPSTRLGTTRTWTATARPATGTTPTPGTSGARTSTRS